MNNKQGRWRLMRPTRNFQKAVAASENGVSGFSRRISTAPPELSTAATAKRDILVNYVIGVRSDYTGTAAWSTAKLPNSHCMMPLILARAAKPCARREQADFSCKPNRNSGATMTCVERIWLQPLLESA